MLCEENDVVCHIMRICILLWSVCGYGSPHTIISDVCGLSVCGTPSSVFHARLEQGLAAALHESEPPAASNTPAEEEFHPPVVPSPLAASSDDAAANPAPAIQDSSVPEEPTTTGTAVV